MLLQLQLQLLLLLHRKTIPLVVIVQINDILSRDCNGDGDSDGYCDVVSIDITEAAETFFVSGTNVRTINVDDVLRDNLTWRSQW